MYNLRIIGVVCAALFLAACSGGGGGGGKTATGTSSSYSADGSQKTITTTYSDGSSSQQTLQGKPTEPSYSGSQLTFTYSFDDGSKSAPQSLNTSQLTSESYSADGKTKTVVYSVGNGKSVSFDLAGSAGVATYSNDGSEKYIPYSFIDSSTHAVTLTGKQEAPKYSSDFLTKTYVYSFSDGTTHDGTTVNGHVDTPQYSQDGSQKTPVYRYDDNTQYFGTTLTGELTTPIYSLDGSQKTLVYSFSDGTTHNGATLTGIRTNPFTDAAIYPSNWTTTGTVTPPSTHPLYYRFTDQTNNIVEDGTQAKPFSQSNLTPNGATGSGAINDPNAFVKFTADAKPLNNDTATTMTFDLRWGTPDPAGPAYVTTWFGANGTATSRTFSSAVSIAGRTVSGQSSPTSGMTLGVPTADVKAAWEKGWTGQGQNVLMLDGYPNPDGSQKPISWSNDELADWYTHGITTYLLASRYAQGAQFYFVDGNGLYDGKAHSAYDNSVPVFQANSHGNLASSARSNPGFYFDVVNISLGYNYWARKITNPTPTQVNQAFLDQEFWTTSVANTLNGTLPSNFGSSGSANVYFTDAVITKAAGNDTITTEKDPLSYKLAYDSVVSSRLLLVGALTSTGSAVDAPKIIAYYSNLAGTDQKIQSRFLTALGGAPYSDTGVAIDGKNIDSGSGTSYAAPRVAGYAAIVRQKFENLTAANTADILLATARYDTLTCYPNCDKAIYGQGEASLSRALAPVGYLR